MHEPRFLRACRRQEVDCTPVWLMRQAGRYMQEYRDLRSRYGMLEICKNPELATQVTMQPINRFDLDAAIIFADILLPLEGMGVDFSFAPDHGPRIHQPIADRQDIDRIRICDPQEDLGYVLEAIRLVRSELPEKIALIGFAGAPFTLASYMIEGGHSRNYISTKRLMYSEPQAWNALMSKVADSTASYLLAQVQAGAQTLQLFDSWVGALSPEDYRQYVMPYIQEIFSQLKPCGVPLIYFGTGTATLLPSMIETGASVLGVDWRVPIRDAFQLVGEELALQGNLDPVALFAPLDVIEPKIDSILQQAQGRRGHIFNLGHGILPGTPVDHVQAVIDWVHEKSGRR